VGPQGVDTLEQLAEVKRVVVEVATDCAVLNADDPLVLKWPQCARRGCDGRFRPARRVDRAGD